VSEPVETAEPFDINDAEQRKLDLVRRLQDINAQLSARRIGTRDADGRHPEPAFQFFDWRKRAVAAKTHIERQLRELNLEIKRFRRAAPIHRAAELGVDATDPEDMLRALYGLVHRLACEGVDLEPDEQALKDAVCEYLNQGRRP
jgi:hypothetical protein